MDRFEQQQKRLDYNRTYLQCPAVQKRILAQERAVNKDFFDSAKERHNTIRYTSGLLEEDMMVHKKAVRQQLLRERSDMGNHHMVGVSQAPVMHNLG